MSEHNIKFQRNQISGNYCALCSCSWVSVEQTFAQAQLRASAHVAGQEWVDVDPLTGEPVQPAEAAHA